MSCTSFWLSFIFVFLRIGLPRRSAAQYSFFISSPTMIIARSLAFIPNYRIFYSMRSFTAYRNVRRGKDKRKNDRRHARRHSAGEQKIRDWITESAIARKIPLTLNNLIRSEVRIRLFPNLIFDEMLAFVLGSHIVATVVAVVAVTAVAVGFVCYARDIWYCSHVNSPLRRILP